MGSYELQTGVMPAFISEDEPRRPFRDSAPKFPVWTLIRNARQ
jgi:hypothetical protein